MPDAKFPVPLFVFGLFPAIGGNVDTIQISSALNRSPEPGVMVASVAAEVSNTKGSGVKPSSQGLLELNAKGGPAR